MRGPSGLSFPSRFLATEPGIYLNADPMLWPGIHGVLIFCRLYRVLVVLLLNRLLGERAKTHGVAILLQLQKELAILDKKRIDLCQIAHEESIQRIRWTGHAC